MQTSQGKKTATLGELAEVVGGRVSGDPSTSISGVAGLDAAGADQISFLANPKYQAQLETTVAAAVIVHPSLDGAIDRPLLLAKNPYLAFARILAYFHDQPFVAAGIMDGASIHPDAVIAESVTISPGCVVAAGARIGANTWLHPNVVVGPDAVIGDECVVYANVSIRERCQLGNRVIVQPGAVIGSDGFGFAPDGARYVKVPQTGRVIVEDDVEIGANACIDRGTLEDTRIGRGSKIDNLVQIAHNVQIGEDCIVVAQVGISGSTTIGRHCTFGGQAAAAGHINIGDNVTVAGRGGISNNVDANQVLAGFPAMPHREWLKAAMTMTHLPEMRREIQRLNKRLAQLEADQSEDTE